MYFHAGWGIKVDMCLNTESKLRLHLEPVNLKLIMCSLTNCVYALLYHKICLEIYISSYSDSDLLLGKEKHSLKWYKLTYINILQC